MKIQLSRLAIIAIVTCLCFFIACMAAIAQGLGDIKESAEAVATMNAMQLLSMVCIALVVALVAVIGFFVRSFAVFQKETAVATATMIKQQEGIAATLHDVAERCANKRCPT